MAITDLVSSNIGNIIPEIWAREVALQATPRRRLARLVERLDFAQAGDLMNFSQLADITATAVTAGSAIGTLTYSEVVDPRQRQVNPFITYAAVQIERSLVNRWLEASQNAVKKRLGISLANRVEIDIATTMVAAQSDPSGGFKNTAQGSLLTAFDVADALTAINLIWENGGDLVNQGQDGLFGVYDGALWDNWITSGVLSAATTNNFLSASVRGEAGGVAVTGQLNTVFGLQIDFTNHIIQATGPPIGYRNVIFTEGSTLLATKEMPVVLVQEFDLTVKIIATMDYGVLVLWPELGVEHSAANA